ncbi:MAG: pantoate kinase [Candidatus Argoarchaeum ethanivorans]|uniref:Pantoate kinase n=1 Tax=Candidatus Argoarchaeum ethanivorans TaxID=2608793 RepID=A0A8B3S1W3_9EURY|nr:MAG: pantoate kinase [Candidatus Argoarchaeum ethanivorans]
MKKITAFAPAHISGFFIPKITKKPEESGSLGAGVCLDAGIIAEASFSDTTRILLNNKPFECSPLVDAIHLLTDAPLKIKLNSAVPIGTGFGASGASTLASVVAANQLQDINLTRNQLAQIAHTAEVINRTGLGDVPAQITGGLVIRLKESVPPRNKIDKILTPPISVSWVSFKNISTKKILEDDTLQKQIVTSGENALKNLIRKPTVENFMIQSNKFTNEVNLASSHVLDAIEAVRAKGYTAAQAMLGDTAFAIGKNVFSEYEHAGTSLVNHTGATLL